MILLAMALHLDILVILHLIKEKLVNDYLKAL